MSNLSKIIKQNQEIFSDTQTRTDSNDIQEMLKNTVIYNKDSLMKDKMSVEIISSDCITAAIDSSEKYPNYRIGVLNFCDALIPGGSVLKGAIAQEEDICRCTNLYPVLSSDKCFSFYLKNRKSKNYEYEDEVIFTPNVKILKNYNYELLKEPILVDVLSAAAPCLNLIEKYNCYDLTYEIHLRRDKLILDVAYSNKIDILILGAFGCGCFHNNPKAVADVFKRLLLSEFRNTFKKVIFAIPLGTNYDIFHKVFYTSILIDNFVIRRFLVSLFHEFNQYHQETYIIYEDSFSSLRIRKIRYNYLYYNEELLGCIRTSSVEIALFDLFSLIFHNDNLCLDIYNLDDDLLGFYKKWENSNYESSINKRN